MVSCLFCPHRSKFLVPDYLTFGELSRIIRKRLELHPHQVCMSPERDSDISSRRIHLNSELRAYPQTQKLTEPITCRPSSC